MDPLLERARAGDRGAWNELAAATASDLRAYLDRSMGERLRRTIALEDLCQDALMQALDAIPALRPDATLEDFRRLLLKNARWIVLDRGRRGGRFAGESVSPVEPGRVEADPPPESRGGAVTHADELRFLRAMIERLDPRYGRILARRMAGAGFAEIALELGETEANVRKRFQRAVTSLKQYVAARAPLDRDAPRSEDRRER